MRFALYGDANSQGVCRQVCGDVDGCADQLYDVEAVSGVADWEVKMRGEKRNSEMGSEIKFRQH